LNRIGIFDSGIGGLTVVRSLRHRFPTAPILYYGDTAHLPYGDKSSETVRSYVRNIVQFLLEQNVSAIVIACNTASAVALDLVKAMAGEIPVFDVITPTVHKGRELTQKKRIGVIGTKTTIASGAYPRFFATLDPSIQVIQKATPLLVPLIENNWIHHPFMEMVLDEYLSDLIFESIDTLILGCTHYPLITIQIQKSLEKMGKGVIHLIESSEAVAESVSNHFEHLDGNGEFQIYVSDLNPHFKNLASKLFPELNLTFQEKVL